MESCVKVPSYRSFLAWDSLWKGPWDPLNSSTPKHARRPETGIVDWVTPVIAEKKLIQTISMNTIQQGFNHPVEFRISLHALPH